MTPVAIETRSLQRSFKGDLDKLAACIGVILVMGAVFTGLSLRAIAEYDRA